MPKSEVVHTRLDAAMGAFVERYRQQENLPSRSESVRALLAIAQRVVENQGGDDTPVSNRELLEEIYRRTRHVNAYAELVHTQTYSSQVIQTTHIDSRAVRDKVKTSVDSKVDVYLEGESTP